jgi:hypothetical protein
VEFPYTQLKGNDCSVGSWLSSCMYYDTRVSVKCLSYIIIAVY